MVMRLLREKDCVSLVDVNF
uniref:Uncharacterized protein n=1 Tax=Anguilla anguilla TaxID=7936 RepID=A0A0E9TVZ3_ANGAN